MSNYSLSHREKVSLIREFNLNNSALSLVSDKTESASNLTFIDFCEYLGVTPTQDQVNISNLVFNQPQTIVVSSHGVGKSLIAACLILYTVVILKGLGITTAPTARQVSKIIFSEIARLFTKLKNNREFKKRFGVDFNNYSIGHTFIRELEPKNIINSKLKLWYELKIDNDSEDNLTNNGLGYAFGFTSKHNDSNSFQGMHFGGFMLIIADEACGISFEIAEAIEACATGINNHVLLIGNPISRDNPFEKNARESGCYVANCFTHPNVAPYYEKVEKDYWVLKDKSCLEPSYKPLIDGAVTPRWIENARTKYGENSLFWRTRVLAKFPRLGDGAGILVPYTYIELATDSASIPSEITEQYAYTPLLVGVDVGESSDPTVVSIGQKFIYDHQEILIVRAIFELETIGDGLQADRNHEFVVNSINSFIKFSYLKEDNVFVSVDNTGLGVSLTKDLLKNTSYVVNPIHFASSASNQKSFKNIRAEMAWELKTHYINGTIKVSNSVILEQIDKLKYELSGISYTQDPITEKIALLPKTILTSILGCSTNTFDAVCLLTQSVKIATLN
jgi:hypothetical protein